MMVARGRIGGAKHGPFSMAPLSGRTWFPHSCKPAKKCHARFRSAVALAAAATALAAPSRFRHPPGPQRAILIPRARSMPDPDNGAKSAEKIPALIIFGRIRGRLSRKRMRAGNESGVRRRSVVPGRANRGPPMPPPAAPAIGVSRGRGSRVPIPPAISWIMKLTIVPNIFDSRLGLRIERCRTAEVWLRKLTSWPRIPLNADCWNSARQPRDPNAEHDERRGLQPRSPAHEVKVQACRPHRRLGVFIFVLFRGPPCLF
jgi:hypothetical protein